MFEIFFGKYLPFGGPLINSLPVQYAVPISVIISGKLKLLQKDMFGEHQRIVPPTYFICHRQDPYPTHHYLTGKIDLSSSDFFYAHPNLDYESKPAEHCNGYVVIDEEERFMGVWWMLEYPSASVVV